MGVTRYCFPLQLHSPPPPPTTHHHTTHPLQTVSKGDSFLFLFIDNTDACAFALDVQLSLYSANWPEALLSLHEMKPDNLWRGLRAKVAVHYGDVKVPAFF